MEVDGQTPTKDEGDAMHLDEDDDSKPPPTPQTHSRPSSPSLSSEAADATTFAETTNGKNEDESLTMEETMK
eukprot:14553258-Ditylum_brightwellii.AAC.1